MGKEILQEGSEQEVLFQDLVATFNNSHFRSHIDEYQEKGTAVLAQALGEQNLKVESEFGRSMAQVVGYLISVAEYQIRERKRGYTLGSNVP